MEKKRRIIIIVIFVILLIIFINNVDKKTQVSNLTETVVTTSNESEVNKNTSNPKIIKANKDLGWELTLVNKDNELPEDYYFTLVKIDEYRSFDGRAIEELNKMITDARKQAKSGIWVQSAYRSVEVQTKLFNNKVEEYIKQGYSRQKAEELTELSINRPGQSEHNLGLAVDFNYVDYSFEETEAFKWLNENAEKYGFILRYPKEKEDITKVEYEPWHWRYVGKENAKKINELDLCLEEYIEYLSE